MVKDSNEQKQQQLALHQLPGELFTQADVEEARWFDCAPDWPEESNNALRGTKAEWIDLAGEALEAASRMFEKKVNGSQNESRRVLDREKTIGDKIASVALLVQESPLHRLDELCTLLSYAKKKGRNERGPAIDALKDLFINDLLPDGRRLIPVHARNFRCERSALTKRHLAYALFESELKTVYAEFLEVLEESGKDSLSYFKQKSVKVIYDLLLAKPENEQTLLAMLVNKLGDPERKVSSTASFNLSELISKHHPQMRVVVVKEVEQLLLRQNVSKKAQYFAVSFLNSIKFTSQDVELARRLIRLYMDLFAACLNEEREENMQMKGDKPKTKTKRVLVRGRVKKVKQKVAKERDDAKNSRLMGALLIGANRAFPFTNPAEDSSSYERHFKALYRVAHANSLEPATNALAFLFQVSRVNASQSDRFYNALYSRVMDVPNAGDSAQASFLNLVFKALKDDPNPRRVRAFVKRLLQAGQFGPSGFAGSCMLAVSEALNSHHKGMLKSFVSLSEDRDDQECFMDAAESDDENDDGQERPASNKTKKQSKQGTGKEDSDSEPELDKQKGINGLLLDELETPTPIQNGKESERRDAYDPFKRDPQYARAENSSLWEVVGLTAHYHPSISLFARTMCVDMKKIAFNSDPLNDFSDISFLDKFVYKKAKNRLAKSLDGKKAARYRDEPVVNSTQFKDQAEAGKVEASDKFFAKYFQANPHKVQRAVDKDEAARRQEGSDFDSEEEAFEEAMREEMRRQGAEEGFLSGGANHHVPDIDDDEDEMKAFEAAFADEMVGSDGSDDEQDDGQGVLTGNEVTELPAFEETDSTNAHDELEDDEDNVAPKKSKKASGSIFAAAEDFEEAIDEELSRSIPTEDGEIGQEENPSKKRKGHGGGKRSKAKRRKQAA